ncbi:MAG TPA: GH1 family beta-glucosidase [Prolixibacteraceae bacterium]|nr:GH1 family beta-glucosidase [Prolixibacteraceae bacterium]
MNRRDWVKISGATGTGFLFSKYLKANSHTDESFRFVKAPEPFLITKSDFGEHFKWGVAAASYQTEGAWNADGKGESTWDRFSRRKGKIERGENADVAADFYHRYEEDIDLVKSMNFKVFRFSLSWPRILPNGTGQVNKAGLDFYHRVIDKCLASGIEPWVTIYHWDLPQALEEQGGWANRNILDWFAEYVELVTNEYGGKVKNWMVMNEQLSFTALGYMLGMFAPGKKSFSSFLKSVHYSVLCNANGGRIIRKNVPEANIGTTFVTSYIEPVDQHPKNVEAASRMDAIINRLFLEPALGLGYPEDSVPALKKLRKYFEPGDEEQMAFDFDFVGLQYYFRTVIEKSIIPIIRAKEVPALKRGVPANEMEGEIYPEGLYHILKKYSGYREIRNIIVTENGTCVPDKVENGRVHDQRRNDYFKDHLAAVLKAKREGVNVNGYLVWSPTDNFEWNKGFRTRFGLVYIDFKTLQRTMKDSGLWFREFLKE